MDVVQESFLRAASFTLIILFLGVLVGLQMDDLRQSYLDDEIRQSNLDTETFTIIEQYMQGNPEAYCDLAEAQLPEISERTAELGQRLERFDEQGRYDQEEYDYLRDRYYNNQLRLYMMLSEYREECDADEDKVLFFFDNSTDSQRQGSVLDEIVRDTDLQVFAFNMETEDSVILDTLQIDYNISQTPTMILNDDEKIEGFISEGELRYEVLE